MDTFEQKNKIKIKLTPQPYNKLALNVPKTPDNRFISVQWYSRHIFIVKAYLECTLNIALQLA